MADHNSHDERHSRPDCGAHEDETDDSSHMPLIGIGDDFL
jgi:hypothetical protein